MGGVRFVPLIGAAGWEDEAGHKPAKEDIEASLSELMGNRVNNLPALNM